MSDAPASFHYPAVCLQSRLVVEARRTVKSATKKVAGGASAGEWYGPSRPRYLGPYSGNPPDYLTGEFAGDYVGATSQELLQHESAG